MNRGRSLLIKKLIILCIHLEDGVRCADISPWLVHSPNDHNAQRWAKVSSKELHPGIPVGAGTQRIVLFSDVFPGALAACWIQNGLSRSLTVFIWDISITTSGLIRYVTILPPLFNLLWQISMLLYSSIFYHFSICLLFLKCNYMWYNCWAPGMLRL